MITPFANHRYSESRDVTTGLLFRMNTLAYADVSEEDTSMASTIISTVQQLSLSFGVAIVLGILTTLSALGFADLKNGDGDNMSHHNVAE